MIIHIKKKASINQDVVEVVVVKRKRNKRKIRKNIKSTIDLDHDQILMKKEKKEKMNSPSHSNQMTDIIKVGKIIKRRWNKREQRRKQNGKQKEKKN